MRQCFEMRTYCFAFFVTDSFPATVFCCFCFCFVVVEQEEEWMFKQMETCSQLAAV